MLRHVLAYYALDERCSPVSLVYMGAHVFARHALRADTCAVRLPEYDGGAEVAVVRPPAAANRRVQVEREKVRASALLCPRVPDRDLPASAHLALLLGLRRKVRRVVAIASPTNAAGCTHTSRASPLRMSKAGTWDGPADASIRGKGARSSHDPCLDPRSLLRALLGAARGLIRRVALALPGLARSSATLARRFGRPAIAHLLSRTRSRGSWQGAQRLVPQVAPHTQLYQTSGGAQGPFALHLGPPPSRTGTLARRTPSCLSRLRAGTCARRLRPRSPRP